MVNIDTSPEISLESLQAGDRAEFARLVDAYSIQIYRLALKMLGDEQDAEDVLQNTFMKALQSIGNFEGRSSLSTWLYRIAVNEVRAELKRWQRDLGISFIHVTHSQEEAMALADLIVVMSEAETPAQPT